ncbi:hypothetical protein, partial [Streptomyces sp. NPDC047108]|uniref:hypothetical protein n=1 Tax=Streptomyces sp. NPDC047108 TaxID=3155025 RepID=UPI0033D642E7
GTLLSSQGTDASFKTVSGFSGRFPSVFPTLPVFFRLPDHASAGMQKRIRNGIENGWVATRALHAVKPQCLRREQGYDSTGRSASEAN